jgi:hypothetical protein
MTYVVGLDKITGKHLAGTDTTVIWALGTGETVLGPAVDLTVGVKESVLLLETEPGLLGSGGLHDLVGVGTVVGGVGRAVVVVTFTEDENVGTTTEGVFEDGNGALLVSSAIASALNGRIIYVATRCQEDETTYQKDVRVVTGSLIGR